MSRAWENAVSHRLPPMRASKLRYLLNFYPPFLFCGIHVTRIADDWARITVRLRLHWWNRNYVGTHFGGSLFSMADPMWMLIVMHRLGERYYVWDKAAEIAFIAAGEGDRVRRLCTGAGRSRGAACGCCWRRESPSLVRSGRENCGGHRRGQSAKTTLRKTQARTPPAGSQLTAPTVRACKLRGV